MDGPRPNGLRFSRAKRWVLPLGHENPLRGCRLGTARGKGPAGVGHLSSYLKSRVASRRKSSGGVMSSIPVK